MNARRNGSSKKNNPDEAARALGRIVHIECFTQEWLYKRWPSSFMTIFIDRDTHRLLQGLIVRSSGTRSLCHVVGLYLVRYGKPGAFHLDRGISFGASGSKASLDNALPNFLKAMEVLGIRIEWANPYLCAIPMLRISQIERLASFVNQCSDVSIEEINRRLRPEFQKINGRSSSGNTVKNTHRMLSRKDNLYQLLGYKA